MEMKISEKVLLGLIGLAALLLLGPKAITIWF